MKNIDNKQTAVNSTGTVAVQPPKIKLKKLDSKWTIGNVLLHIFFFICSAMCVLPLLLVLSISFTSERGILENGYTLFPSILSFESYDYILKNADTIFNAYGVTILVTIIGAIASVMVISLYAYPISRKDFRYKNAFTFYIFFTMLFNGGVVSWYMVCVHILNIKDTLFALIMPYLMNAWYVIIMRTFFQTTIPDAIIESAKIDGAGEFRIFFRLVLPLSLPGLATVGLFMTLTYWNDWWLPLMLINDSKLYNLQYLLQQMINKIETLYELGGEVGNASIELMNIPKEGARMALCIIAAGPIVAVYPFFQKYFIQGLTIGAVKG